ncbi:DUF397 domain-containing protein [Streptomyces roseochromogenus]|uniref:DUF397 domain-containing protein n=1 Tax=Streptomyces roseochromogenus subsp. oscitans DS 12.976 TaxID=1352936 RepID=V6KN20_STRRC|nr:DUF397 domain-containing protein [Streptomyces roseochromogenus]EST33580.1 hypothetical protein M878_12705 [Streptomyces roseochromogenus subsp. oscitans DS 12.976]
MPAYPVSIELAPEHAWFKSSYSDPGQNCLEAAPLHPHIAIRDSKAPHGPALLLPARAWTEFITHLAGK